MIICIAEVDPQKECHKPNRTSMWTRPVKGATVGSLPNTGEDMLHNSNAGFEPSLRDSMMAAPDWVVAKSRGTEWAYPLLWGEP